MKILVASDSFKESMTSLEVAEIVEKAFLDQDKTNSVIKVPISDGGEGFVESLVYATNGIIKNVLVKDSLGHDKLAYYGISSTLDTAFIEMATANGLEGIRPEDRNPVNTSTFGTGQLITAALDDGVKKIIIGIGGSATNDGGAGMARALGVKFLDESKMDLDGSGGSLARLHSIDDSKIDKRIKDVEFIVASDVDNPLIGWNGASHIYARQKGADDKMISLLDDNLSNYARIIKQKYNKDISRIPSSGAAGGLGAGLMIFADAIFKSGIDVVLDTVNLEEKLAGVDLVITGEGRIDSQTIYGKAPIGVAKRAKAKGLPVIAFCGVTSEGYEVVYDHGIDKVYQITNEIKPVSELLKEGKENLYKKALNVAKELRLIR